MSDIFSIGLSALQSSRQRALASANNLANLNTNGYKSQRVNSATGPGGQGTRTDSVTTNFTQGSIIASDDPFDLAINGNGYFQVSDGNGNISYTRDGNFTPDAQGRLSTPDGQILQPEIQIPPQAENVSIASDGSVTAQVDGQQTELGQIELAQFSNPDGMLRQGNNMLAASDSSGIPNAGAPGQDGRGIIMSGYQENSNVDIAREAINLTMEERITSATAKIIKTADEMQKEAINLMG